MDRKDWTYDSRVSYAFLGGGSRHAGRFRTVLGFLLRKLKKLHCELTPYVSGHSRLATAGRRYFGIVKSVRYVRFQDARLFIPRECCFSGHRLSVRNFPPVFILRRLRFPIFRILACGASIFRFPGNSKFQQKLPPRLRVWPPMCF